MRVVETYTRRLGTGIVNMANGFRPQMVILGGQLPQNADWMLDYIRKMLSEECFGREQGDVPELEMSALLDNAGVIGAASLL